MVDCQGLRKDVRTGFVPSIDEPHDRGAEVRVAVKDEISRRGVVRKTSELA